MQIQDMLKISTNVVSNTWGQAVEMSRSLAEPHQSQKELSWSKLELLSRRKLSGAGQSSQKQQCQEQPHGIEPSICSRGALKGLSCSFSHCHGHGEPAAASGHHLVFVPWIRRTQAMTEHLPSCLCHCNHTKPNWRGEHLFLYVKHLLCLY